jgi:hypothetical protein
VYESLNTSSRPSVAFAKTTRTCACSIAPLRHAHARPRVGDRAWPLRFAETAGSSLVGFIVSSGNKIYTIWKGGRSCQDRIGLSPTMNHDDWLNEEYCAWRKPGRVG